MTLQASWNENQPLFEATPDNDLLGSAPTPAPEPEIDVDAWFAQREPMIEALKARREALLSEVQEIERRLGILGVGAPVQAAPDEPAAKKPKAARPPKPAKIKGNPYLDGVRRTKARAAPAKTGKPDRTAELVKAMSRTPEKVADIGKRLGWGYATTWRVLEEAQKRGLVKSSGIKGKDMRWAVA